MENFVLSPNVKKYFVNALKSIGLRKPGQVNGAYQEMSETEISMLLDDTTTSAQTIYNGIKLAVLQQFQNDAKSNKLIQKNTALDRQVVNDIMVNDLKIAPASSNRLLRSLTAASVDENGVVLSEDSNNLDAIINAVINAMDQGLVDQQLTQSESDEAKLLWDNVVNAQSNPNYEQWLQKNHLQRPQDGTAEDKAYQAKATYEKDRSRLIDEIKTNCGGDETKATSLLNQPINDEMVNKIMATKLLLTSWMEYCRRREAEGKTEPEYINEETDNERKATLCLRDGSITMQDVLMAARNMGVQELTFFQSRSEEQQQQAKAPGSEVKKENKIGNVLGKSGREFVEARTNAGGGIYYDNSSNSLKKGKRGPYRGYKALYDRIKSFLSGDIYLGRVPAIGFSQIVITDKTGHSFEVEEELNKNNGLNNSEHQTQTRPNATDYQPLDKKYFNDDGTMNIAGEFYSKVTARLIEDKMQLQAASIRIDDFSGKEQEENNSLLDYLRERIKSAETILKKGIPDSNSPYFKEPKYYEEINNEIVAKGKYKDNNFVSYYIMGDENYSNNERLIDALSCFEKMTMEGMSLKEQNAKREMALNMFHLHSYYDSNKINNEELDQLIKRFFNSNGYGQLLTDLHNGKINSIEATRKINDFVEDDLKHHALKKACEELDIEQKGKQYMQQAAEEVMSL